MQGSRGIATNVDKLVVLQSMLVGFFIDVKCMNYIIGAYGASEDSSVMTLLYMFIVGAILFVGFFQQKTVFPKLNTHAFLIFSYVCFLFLFSTVFLKEAYTVTPHFIVFTLCAFLVPFSSQIDTRILLKSIMLYPVIGITHLSSIFVFVTDWNEWISMGLSYAFLVPIASTIVYLFQYFKEENWFGRIITLALTGVNLTYLVMLLQFGSRGPLFILAVLIGVMFCVKYDKSIEKVVIKSQRAWLVIIAAIVFILFFSSIVSLISDIISSAGVSSRAVNKLLALESEGDLSNGRSPITHMAIEGFFSSPIWGHGFDQFLANTGYVYPHNFILQMLYDGGLIMALIIIPKTITLSIRKLKFCTQDLFALFSFLFAIGLLGGLFSEDMWKQPMLWITIGFILSDTFCISRNNDYHE